MQPDVLVYGGTGETVAAIEVKNRPNVSARDAVMFRRNMLAHSEAEQPQYFLIVSQDTGYLWGPGKRHEPSAEPDLAFSMAPVLERYAVSPISGRLFASQLELLVSAWAQSLADLRGSPVQTEPEVSLARAHFLDAVRSGRVFAQGHG